MERGEYDRAEELFATVLASHSKRGDRRTVAFTMGWVGLLAARRGDFARAIRLQETAIATLEPVAERGYRILSLVRLAAAHHASGAPGNHAAAVEITYLPPLKAEGRLWPIAYALTELGTMLRDNGEYARARGALTEALEFRRQTGGLHGVAEARLLLGTVHHRSGDKSGAASTIASAMIGAREFGAVPTLIDGLEASAALLADTSRFDIAAILLSAAERERKSRGAPRAPRYDDDAARLHARLASELGPRQLAHVLDTDPSGDMQRAVTIALDGMRSVSLV
jgi:tetratricopeptide (TPR) repeat protein